MTVDRSRRSRSEAKPANVSPRARPTSAAAEPGITLGLLRSDGYVAALAGTALLSAYLLFSVQPLVSKQLLPRYGGSPGVWLSCMLFFQALLLAGYGYSHGLSRCLPLRWQRVVHMALLGAAVVVLIAGTVRGLPEPWLVAPALDILLTLAASVGLPFLALSTTAPLIQTWFHRRYPSVSPYRLYALSNAGSIAALLAFPFVLEPTLALSSQQLLWAGGFIVFALACLVLTWPQQGDENAGPVSQPAAGAAALSYRQVMAWVLLPAVATMSLSATTNRLCQEVASIPLLWILPLLLYLLSFVMVFDSSRWYRPRSSARIGLALVGAVAGLAPSGAWFGQVNLELVYVMAMCLAALFFICLICHGEIARTKPEPRHLTCFYLCVGLGGVLGTAMVSLLAPWLFSSYFEWQLSLIFASWTMIPLALAGAPRLRPRWVRWGAGLAAALTILYVCQEHEIRPPLERVRSFFGVITIRDFDPDQPAIHDRAMLHGSMYHGRQFLHPDRRRWPTTYYGQQSGVGLALAALQKRPRLHVGGVGLGVGTVATYARPIDSYAFYEIDPEVLRLARRHFTYLSDCQGEVEVLIGDARQALESQEPQNFDLLILDAFSSDSIPVHLLTVEAFQVYQLHLAENGALAVHISNQFLQLEPVLKGVAQRLGWQSRLIVSPIDIDRLWFRARWIILSRDAELLSALGPFAESLDAYSTAEWTDNHSNLLAVLKPRRENDFGKKKPGRKPYSN